MNAESIRAEDLFEVFEIDWVPPADAEMQRLSDILAVWKDEAEARRMVTIETGNLLRFELRKRRVK